MTVSPTTFAPLIVVLAVNLIWQDTASAPTVTLIPPGLALAPSLMGMLFGPVRTGVHVPTAVPGTTETASAKVAVWPVLLKMRTPTEPGCGAGGLDTFTTPLSIVA